MNIKVDLNQIVLLLKIIKEQFNNWVVNLMCIKNKLSELYLTFEAWV